LILSNKTVISLQIVHKVGIVMQDDPMESVNIAERYCRLTLEW